MYYYYIYALKGDYVLKEFAAYTRKHDIDEVFDDLNKQGYDCVVIDELTREQYLAQEDPYGV